jgi:hypothetical protein
MVNLLVEFLVEAVACARPDLQEQDNGFGDFVREKLQFVRKADEGVLCGAGALVRRF